MAFSWAGDLTGCLPVKRYFQIGADVYQGQMVQADNATSGGVKPAAVAAAGPDTGSQILGICTGIVTNPSFDSTYKGDKGTYTVTQATLAGYDPPGPVLAEVVLVTPTTLIRGPVCKDTIGTAPERKSNTTASTTGLAVVTATVDTTVNFYSTIYCSVGANRGQSRIVTTAGTTTQTVVLPFTYDIAIGDVFVIANIREGRSKIDFVSTINGLDSSIPYSSNYFVAYVHQLNLEEAGKEYAIFTLHHDHLVIG